MKRILYLVPARLGDALMITPALALLKHLQPQYSVDILAFGSLGGEVYENNPYCNRIYLKSSIQNIDQFLQAYDFIVSAHRDSKIYESLPKLNKPIILIEPADQLQAQAQQALNFIECLFSDRQQSLETKDYELFPRPTDYGYAQQLLSNDKKYIGFHLGCHGLNNKRSLFPWRKNNQHKKVWPLENFITLAKQLNNLHNDYQIVLTGSPNERHLADDFKRHVPNVVDVVGKTNLLQLAALMQRFSVYLCSDTGTMHVACAMKTPLIALFGPTNINRTGPYPQNNLWKTIESENLSQLNPEVVLSEIKKLLKYAN